MLNIIPIQTLNHPELSLYTSFSEVQLLRYYEPDPGLMIVESPNVIERALQAGYTPVSFLTEKKYIKEHPLSLFSLFPDVPIYTSSLDVLSNILGFTMTRGLLAILKRKKLPEVNDLCAVGKRIAILENIVNPTNIGAIFRSAAALNIDSILLTKGCCDPFYKRSSRVSMGSVFQIPWTYTDNHYFSTLHTYGFKTVALALLEEAIRIDDPILSNIEKLAIFLGKESTGLADSTISSCDYTVQIPMSNNVDSLNVAAASAVAFWQLASGNNRTC